MADPAPSSVDVSDEARRPSSIAAVAATRFGVSLIANFRKSQAIFNEVQNSKLSSNNPELQNRIIEGLGLCEAALMQVANNDIFSPNELGEDINTNDLKYLLLPFYRGELLLRVSDQSKRREALREALLGLRGFMKDQERLELLQPEAIDWQAMGGSASNPAEVRNQKIARFKANKAAQEKMAAVQEKLAKAGSRARDGSDDDEEEDDGDSLEREHVLLLLQICCCTAMDSIRTAEMEADMLAQIEKMRRPDGSLPPPPTREANDPRDGLQMINLVPPPQAGGGAAAAAAAAAVATLGGGGGTGGARSEPNALGLSTVNPWRDQSSRLSYSTAMRQVHTGEIPGLCACHAPYSSSAEPAHLPPHPRRA